MHYHVLKLEIHQKGRENIREHRMCGAKFVLLVCVCGVLLCLSCCFCMGVPTVPDCPLLPSQFNPSLPTGEVTFFYLANYIISMFWKIQPSSSTLL